MVDGFLTVRFSDHNEIMRAYYELIHNSDEGFVSHPERMEIDMTKQELELIDKKNIKYKNWFYPIDL